MNPDVRARWAAALRSNHFRQGHNKLTVTGADGVTRHCCLGVLCELAREDGVPLRVRDADTKIIAGRVTRSYDGAVNFPPAAVLRWAELDDRNPSVRHEGRTRTLGFLNDELTTSFATIADLIEEQL